MHPLITISISWYSLTTSQISCNLHAEKQVGIFRLLQLYVEMEWSHFNGVTMEENVFRRKLRNIREKWYCILTYYQVYIKTKCSGWKNESGHHRKDLLRGISSQKTFCNEAIRTAVFIIKSYRSSQRRYSCNTLV